MENSIPHMNDKAISYKKFNGIDGLISIADEWKQLVNENDTCEFYHAYEWYLTYLEHLCDTPDSIFFVCAYENNELVAIFPLTLTKKKISIVSINILSFPFHSHMTLYDFVIAQKHLPTNNLIQDLLSFLEKAENINWDIACFASVIEGSNIAKQIDHENINSTLKNTIDKSYSITCTHDYDETIAHMPGNFRRNVARLERKALKQAEISFDRVTSDDIIKDEFLDTFIDIENESWKGSNNSSIKSHQSLIGYYKGLANNFKQTTPCIISLLKFNDEYIAGQFGILFNKKVNLLKIGFKEIHSNIGPGNIIMAHALRKCTKANDHSTLNIVTAPKWADKWTNNIKEVYTYYLFNNSIKGVLTRIIFNTRNHIKKLKNKTS